MEKYDVLVVGAGPGGSAAARKCRDGGLKTLLIDKQKLPRRKACSGIIANKSQNYVLENFGPIPESAYGKPYHSRGMAFYFPSVGTIFTDCNCFQPYVWRNKFDHFLAKASGADLEDETLFVGLKEKGEEIEVTLERKKNKVQLMVKYLIGADGANSHVIRSFAPEVYDGMTWASAIQKYYEGRIDADNRYLYWFLVRGMGPFPWLNLKDDQIIIGCAYPVGQKSNKFEALIDFLKKNFGLSIKSEIATEGCMANTMTPLNRFFPGRGRVLMVGDAMGLMHQGGEGISCALASGGHAGAAVTEAIRQGTDAFSLYKKSVRPEMVTSLDQFNPLRMKATVASDTKGQPGLFHAHSLGDELKALRDALVFVKSEFQIKGMIGSILKNSARRFFLGGYHIPAVDK
ncbi:MAG: NAD(P)/FAD-dependent oxidoreductase [bacterium]|nr:NAD(P)/FAD-dependent oxidoreductase [bacterium]